MICVICEQPFTPPPTLIQEPTMLALRNNYCQPCHRNGVRNLALGLPSREEGDGHRFYSGDDHMLPF